MIGRAVSLPSLCTPTVIILAGFHLPASKDWLAGYRKLQNEGMIFDAGKSAI